VRAVYDPKYGVVGWVFLRWDFNPETNTTNVYPVEPVLANDIGFWARRR